MKRNNSLKGISLYVVIFLIFTMLSSIFIGKIISTSVTYSLENPYHFEKVVAEIVSVKKVESEHNFNDYYFRIAQYVDEETGYIYETYVPGKIYDKAEAEAHIGEKVYILIEKQYGKAIAYVEGAKKGGAPIDIIVYSVLLLLCLSISVFCIVKITKKNKKHWIWIAICILLLLGLAAYVAYASFDMNYLDQLFSISETVEKYKGL